MRILQKYLLLFASLILLFIFINLNPEEYTRGSKLIIGYNWIVLIKLYIFL
jgi:hypothetical protein